MQRLNSKVLWLVGGVFLATLAMSPVMLTARPTMPAKTIPPAVVATVDLELVFNSLAEKAARDQELQAFANDLQAKQDALRAEISSINDELGGLAQGSSAYQQKFGTLQLKTLEYQAKIEHNKLQLDKKKGIVLRNLYIGIKSEVRKYSKEMGIDIVMLDDSIVDIDLGSEQEVSRQISARRTLYCNPDLDVTKDVIDRMNTTFNSK